MRRGRGKRYWLPFAAIIVVLILVIAGCEKEKAEQSTPPHLDGSSLIQEEAPAPENLTCAAGNNEIVLAWENPDSEEITGYIVYRWRSGEAPQVTKRLPAGTTTFTDGQVQNGTTYFYLVLSENSSKTPCAVSSQSQALATPQAPPPPPPPVVEEPEYYPEPEPTPPGPPSEPSPPPPPADPPCPPGPPGGG